ncbi:TPA: DUF3168 domain-containing protein [Proteus mirabilis]
MIQQLKETLSLLVDGRVFFQVLPEGKGQYPAIVIQFASITPNSALEDTDLDNYRVQLDVYAPHPQPLMVLRKKIEAQIVATIPFAQRVNAVFGYEADVKLHRLVLELMISSDK